MEEDVYSELLTMSAHLERVLRHADKKLQGAAKRAPVDSLDLYRNFLKIEERRLYLAHKAGGGGLEIARRRADLMTVVLKHLFENALASAELSGSVTRKEAVISLLAVGGFGRGELCPHSDIDILFVYDKFRAKSAPQRFVEDVIEQVLYALWDIGLKVGHASRSMDDVVKQGNEDFQTLTSLLEAKVLAGSNELFERMQVKFDRVCIQGKAKAYLRWRLADQTDRHAKYSGTPFLQEPNIKNGCGGLRDYQNLLWMARVRKGFTSTRDLEKAGYLTAKERKDLDAAYDFLLRVRNDLHFREKRAVEVITLRMQGEIAKAFHYPQKHILRKVEAFMRDYYQYARQIYLTANWLTRRWGGSKKAASPRWLFLPRRARKYREHGQFYMEDGQLWAKSDDVFKKDALQLLSVFQIFQDENAELSVELEKLIRLHRDDFTRKLARIEQTSEMFMSILSQRGKVGRVLRAMHECGILEKVVPEFAPLTCLVQHEFFHQYSADEHTLVCLEQMDRVLDCPEQPFVEYKPLMTEITDPGIMYLALLLHDTGKAEITQDHSQASAQFAARLAKRFKLKGDRLRNLIFLVDHHGSLMEFALRRNMDDPDTIREFARIVQDPARLDMLMLLTFADVNGVAEGHSWSNWKEVLVWLLYRRTKDMLAGEEEFLKKAKLHSEEVRKSVQQQVSADIDDDEFESHFLMMPNFYLNHANEPTIARQMMTAHRFIVRQVQGVSDFLRPEITWRARPNQGHTEMIMAHWDSPRLFSRTAGSLTVAGMNILSADIFTRKDDLVVDTFSVCTDRHEAVTDTRDQKLFEKTLQKVLLDPSYDLNGEIREARAKQRDHRVDGGTVAAKLELNNYTLKDYTLLAVQAPDFLGLLYLITSCLADAELNIAHARIVTGKGVALDTFYLQTKEREKLENKRKQEKLLRDLRQILKDEAS